MLQQPLATCNYIQVNYSDARTRTYLLALLVVKLTCIMLPLTAAAAHTSSVFTVSCTMLAPMSQDHATIQP